MCALFSWNPYADCRVLYGFYLLKPDTKRCKPHGTPSTWTLEDQEFYMSFSLADSHSYPGKVYSQNAFPSGYQEHSSTKQHSTMAIEIFKVPLDSAILTRSLRGLYEICTRSVFCKGRQQGKAAGQGSRARQQGKAAGQGTLPCSPPLEILTRSLRDLYEICFLQGKAAGQGSRARHSTLLSSSLLSSLLYAALLYSTLPYPTLPYSTLLYTTVPRWPLYSSPLDSALLILLCSTPL